MHTLHTWEQTNETPTRYLGSHWLASPNGKRLKGKPMELRVHVIVRVVVVVSHQIFRQRDFAQSFAKLSILRLLLNFALDSNVVYDLLHHTR